jgi:hypothetical protein
MFNTNIKYYIDKRNISKEYINNIKNKSNKINIQFINLITLDNELKLSRYAINNIINDNKNLLKFKLLKNSMYLSPYYFFFINETREDYNELKELYEFLTM